MAKQGVLTGVPRRRFPEFGSAPKWEESLLEDLEKCGWIELGRGNVISASDMRGFPGSFPVYSSSIKNDGHMGSYGRFMFDEELISWSVDGGGNFFHRPRHKFSITNVSGYMRLKTDRLLYRFVAAQLQSLHATHTFDYQLKAHPSVIRKLYRLGLPSRAEQQKIADCLTSLDEVIAAQGRKVEALKAHKRGLMQQLFPREGEAHPRLRFPEFRNAPEWESVKFFDLISDVLDFRGRTPTKLGMEWGGGDIISLSANNVKNGYIDYHAECYLASEELHSRWMVGANLEMGDIVFTMEAPLGKALLIPDERKYVLSQRVVAFKTKHTVVNAFMLQLIWSDVFQNAIGLLATGSTAKGVSQKSLQGLMVTLPGKIEQRRIADCLFSLDTLISGESDQLAALKTHKQGLMQQLFPAPEGIGA